jgi:hypothetical protein
MKSCPHEAEVKAILRQGHWPEACDRELRQHIQTCRTCSEQLLVLHAFHAARAHTMRAAPIDHPNLLWWRAQLRRRNQALQSVGRPITTAQIFALCISILTAAAVLRSQLASGFNWSSWFPQSSSDSSFDALSFVTSITTDWGLFLPLIGLGTVLLLSAVVVYLVSDRS